MNEETREVESHQSYMAKRIQEVTSQRTFGTPDMEELEPILQDIQEGNYRKLCICYTSKEGNFVQFKSK